MDIMGSPSSKSSSNGSQSRMIRTDLESNVQERQRLLLRARMAAATRLKGHWRSDLFKLLACVATTLQESVANFPPLRYWHCLFCRCIFQFLWIQRLHAGFRRIPNDPFDLRFGEDIDRNSPSIWDNYRQAFIHNAIPVPIHSHNDYLQRIPLFEALASGCVSVEADIYLRNSDLLIGHTPSDLHDGSTLRSMYLEPLQRMLEMQNAHISDGKWQGIFNHAPDQTVTFLVDHKTTGPETFAELDAQLQPLRDLDYLTYWNGTERVVRPLTIVASGDAPFESVIALNETRRDIFWDAKLDTLVSHDDDFSSKQPIYGYNSSNSYFASTEWSRAWLRVNSHLPPPSNPSQSDVWFTQIEQAKARGLIARYWNTPSNPPNVRDIAWRVLVELQVGILNMDDLDIVRARAGGWGKITS